jgi:hypothetical protein
VADGPPDGPVAYCAPGQETAAARILEDNGQAVTRIVEHPWLEGRAGYVLIVHPEALREPPEIPWPTVADPAGWCRDSLLRELRASAAVKERN